MTNQLSLKNCLMMARSLLWLIQQKETRKHRMGIPCKMGGGPEQQLLVHVRQEHVLFGNVSTGST